MVSVLAVFVAACLSFGSGLPYHEGHSENVGAGFIGRGTNELATALLQGYVQKEEDMVYSPFGYSAILAIFSEGARGSSREEIADALYFPKDVDNVRTAYKTVLERFVGKKVSNSPEFKNWFYIYKNYTVNKELEDVLRKYYLTEVKTVDRPEEYIKETKKSPIMEPGDKTAEEVPAEKPSITVVETLTEEEKPTKPKVEELKPTKPEMEVVKPTKPEVEELKPTKPELEEMKPTKPKVEELKPTKPEMEELKPTKPEMEEVKPTKVEEESTTKEEMKSEEMKSSEPREGKAKDMEKTEMDHFSGMTDSSLKIKTRDSEPRMVVFNGLYYKGEWETPFDKKPADDSRPFYKSDEKKIFVSTIHSQGVFNYGPISELDCRAIELPYKGGRYSLLVLVPNARNGLSKLISDLSGYSFHGINDKLSQKLVDVCLPSFEINTISKPISSPKKMGLKKVTSIFNPETADLTGISTNESGLFVEELVQMVSFKVDAEYSKANFLTASIASSRSNAQKFQINQPFLFYLRDNVDDIIIVNGKVIDPTPKPNLYFS